MQSCFLFHIVVLKKDSNFSLKFVFFCKEKIYYICASKLDEVKISLKLSLTTWCSISKNAISWLKNKFVAISLCNVTYLKMFALLEICITVWITVLPAMTIPLIGMLLVRLYPCFILVLLGNALYLTSFVWRSNLEALN